MNWLTGKAQFVGPVPLFFLRRVIIPTLESVFCYVKYPDRTVYTTMGTRVFDAAANALRWVEVDRQAFGTARRFHDDETLVIGVGMVPDRWYRVKVGECASGRANAGLTAARDRLDRNPLASRTIVGDAATP